MFEHIVHRDFVMTEAEYRLGRARADIAGRRRRRILTRRDVGSTGEAGWTDAR